MAEVELRIQDGMAVFGSDEILEPADVLAAAIIAEEKLLQFGFGYECEGVCGV